LDEWRGKKAAARGLRLFRDQEVGLENFPLAHVSSIQGSEAVKLHPAFQFHFMIPFGNDRVL
jgi:hypothetical protein